MEISTSYLMINQRTVQDTIEPTSIPTFSSIIPNPNVHTKFSINIVNGVHNRSWQNVQYSLQYLNEHPPNNNIKYVVIRISKIKNYATLCKLRGQKQH